MAKRLRAVRPNHGLELQYRRRLEVMIDRMIRSVLYWLRAAYNQNQPVLAQDDTPVDAIIARMRWLARRWQKKFDEAAPRLAEYFAKAVEGRSAKTLAKILRDGGFSVKFQPTPAVKEIMAATIQANVALIRSISQEYLNDVAGAVMRSVQTGRDLHHLTKDLQEIGGVTRRRAEIIALHQTNSSTSAFLRTRQTECGIDRAIWRHSSGGKKPRPHHVAMSGKEYKISEGMYDIVEKRNVWPGELISCRCVSIPLVPGFS